MKGLGDLVHKATKITGVQAIVKAVTSDCGCEKRREILNNKFPFKK
jgi:hypothetical protein